ncbi:MAG: hypothetical protein ABL997_07370 [Planctomycetota bacterium]
MNRSPRVAVPFALLLTLTACSGGDDYEPAPVQIPDPVPVSILVEVYDPVTNFVWQNVGVRIVESEQEWSQCLCVNQYEDWYLTDGAGQAMLTEYDLAYADVGFREDGNGRAVLWPGQFEDEATVVLEVWADGFTPVFVEVDLCFCQPDVFVAIPFR